MQAPGTGWELQLAPCPEKDTAICQSFALGPAPSGQVRSQQFDQDSTVPVGSDHIAIDAAQQLDDISTFNDVCYLLWLSCTDHHALKIMDIRDTMTFYVESDDISNRMNAFADMS